MKRILEYRILEATSPNGLAVKVNEMLCGSDQQWEPHGSPWMISRDDLDNDYLYQAMVRTEDPTHA